MEDKNNFLRWQKQREKIKQARFRKVNEKKITIEEKIAEIKNAIAKRWFYAYDIMENVKKQDEDKKVEERHKILKKLIKKEQFDKFFSLFKIIFLATFAIITITGPFVIMFLPGEITEEYKNMINIILLIIFLFCVYKVFKTIISIEFEGINNPNFLKKTFWFNDPKVLILANMAIIWEKVIKLQNWDISWQELILNTLYVNSNSKVMISDYSKIPYNTGIENLLEFKKYFFYLEALSQEIKFIITKIEKNLQNIQNWKWQFQILNWNLKKLKNTNKEVLSNKENIKILVPKVNFKKYNLWLNESFILPLKWIKSFLIKNLEQIKNLISENESNQSEQIKLLQKRLEINKNLLEEKISELDAEIKKLEN